MKQNVNTIRRVAAMVIGVCLLLCMFPSCGGNTATTDKTAYTLRVQTEGGMPLSGVRVTVYEDEAQTDMVWAAQTDKNGAVSFSAVPVAGMTAVVSELSDGYTAASSYAVESETQTLLVTSKLRDGELSDNQMALGDMMCDFTVSAGDREYKLSDLLADGQLVVLNFWFEGCGPCRAEFPYLQKAYAKYADKVTVLAINPYDGTDASVADYARQLDLTFPVIKDTSVWQNALQITAFPTTVVIDRYGMIAFVHKGAVTQEGVFETLFDYFVSDDYVQKTVRNFDELA